MMYNHRVFGVFLMAVSLLSATLSANAQATYYVRSGASGNGSDWANAYSSLPTTLVRGATYYVATGSYGGRTFSTAASGTSVITIKKATVSDHGTSTGWQDSYGTGTATFGNLYFTTPYWVFDGAYRNSDWRSGYGFKINVSGGFGSAGIYYGSGPLSASWGGQDSTAANITVRYVEIQGMGLDNANHDVAAKGVWGINNLTFSYCYFHDFGNCVFMTDHNSGWVIEYGVYARNSSDATYHAEGLAAQGDDNVIIRYNIWEDIEGTGYIVNLGRDSNINQADNWAIYGNVFMYTPGNPYNRTGVGDGAIVCLDDSGNKEYATNWKIYNNTFINIPGYSSGIEFGASPVSGVPNNQNVLVYNNFWWGNPAPASQVLGACTGCVSDYNRFDGTSGGTGSHSQINSTASQSVFVNYSGKDFRLTAATAAGLAQVSPYNVDANGLTRGADGVWDMGAYEYSSGASDSTPPTLSSISAGSITTSSATINWTASENSTGSIQLGTTTSYGTTVADPNLTTVHATAVSGLQSGTLYHYRIVATDSSANSTTTGDYTFTTATPDTTGPTVSVTAPTAGAVVSNTVTLTASASDSGSGVSNVTFLVDGTSVGTDSSSPYSVSWNSLSSANGSHTITARALDVAGNQTTSSSVTVTLQNPTPDTIAPTVSMTSPTSGTMVSNTVTLTASATDSGSGISNVVFLVDGSSVGTDSSSPYSMSWSSLSVANGSHTVTARATDVAGNQTTSSSVTLNVQNPAPSSIVGDWLFDEASGTTAVDSSDYGNNGTLYNGPVRTSDGRATQVLQFDGVNDYVRVPSSSSLNMTNAMTISLWVKVSSSGSWQTIVGKLVSEGANTYPFYDYSLVAVGGTGGFYARAAIATASSTYVYADSSSLVSYDAWHHLVAVYNGSTLTIYVDGVSAGSVAGTGALKTSGQALFMGRNGSGGDNFKGTIDDVRLYNRALSATEIQNVYGEMTIPPPSNLRVLE